MRIRDYIDTGDSLFEDNIEGIFSSLHISQQNSNYRMNRENRSGIHAWWPKFQNELIPFYSKVKSIHSKTTPNGAEY